MSASTAKSATVVTSYLLLAVWAMISTVLLSAVVVDETGIISFSENPQYERVIQDAHKSGIASNLS
ncbi:hypothetical protein [Hahella ganghwensis]|uniref:hypothetical protein n=1 Tax=Hahella ganghwensis TaxID=286420 RepID=UPI00037E8531|nr:hypothetical protein [Hahella ganghwensis]